jgi:hypothetical protein
VKLKGFIPCRAPSRSAGILCGCPGDEFVWKRRSSPGTRLWDAFDSSVSLLPTLVSLQQQMKIIYFKLSVQTVTSVPKSSSSSYGSIAQFGPGLPFWGFVTITVLQGWIVSFTPNPQPRGPGLRIYDPRTQGGPAVPPGTGYPF